MRRVGYDRVCERVLNEPERCASAVRQDAGSYTGLGLFANATHRRTRSVPKKTLLTGST